MMDVITVGGVTIGRGEACVVPVQLPKLYDCTEMTMPVHVLRGKKPGPILFVSAAIHGDEINGVEIVRRLLQLKLLKSLHGTLIAIPLVNVYGFLNRSRYLPDHRDLNRSFPGSEQGSLASRVAYRFIEQVVSQCTHGIDLHSGSNHRQNLPQIRCEWDDDEGLDFAKAFGAPLIVDSKLRDNSLRATVNDMGIPVLVYEAGEALRFDEASIRGGVKGIISVMRYLKMVPSRKIKYMPKSVVSHKTFWVRSPVSGLLRQVCHLGDFVNKDEVLGYIENPLNSKRHSVVATQAGVLMGVQNMPLVYQGDALFHLAVLNTDVDSGSIETFQGLVEDYI